MRNLTRQEREREKARQAAEESGKQAPLFPEFFDDPCGFVEKKLGIRLWSKQRKILLAIARKKKVAIRSGQKTGKSTCFVAAALWWACTRPRARVLLTAPGNKQVRNVLWKELRRIVYDRTAPGGQRVCDLLGVEPAVQPSTGMQWPDGREIIGFSADVPENMQGFSGPETLTLIDEASGVDDPIFEAIDGNAAGGGHICAAGNPTRQSGWFFDAFHTKRNFWEGIEISSEETPNVTGLEPGIPGLATPEFIAQRAEEYGRESAWFLVRIRGKFAGGASNAVVSLELIEKSRERWDERPANDVPHEPLVFGLDVARFGDDSTSITPRRGVRAFPPESKQGLDTLAIVGALIELREAFAIGNEIATVNIDSTGGYGAGVADVLRASHADKFRVVELNSSEKSDDPEVNFNLRTQLHFGVTEWLKGGGELPPDRKLEAELLAPIYKFDDRGRRKVESKDDIKKRIKRSPDRADSLALAVYAGTHGAPLIIPSRSGSALRVTSRGY